MKFTLLHILGTLLLGLGLVAGAWPEGTPSEAQTAKPTEMKAEVASEPEVFTVTVTGSVVNVRAGPSLQHAVLGQVRQGMHCR